MEIWENIYYLCGVNWFRSSVGLEQRPSKAKVQGSNPCGITKAMIRLIYIIMVLLANFAVLAHGIVPHHHHIEASSCPIECERDSCLHDIGDYSVIVDSFDSQSSELGQSDMALLSDPGYYSWEPGEGACYSDKEKNIIYSFIVGDLALRSPPSCFV